MMIKSKNYMHMPVHSSIVHNSQKVKTNKQKKVKTAQMSIKDEGINKLWYYMYIQQNNIQP